VLKGGLVDHAMRRARETEVRQLRDELQEANIRDRLEVGTRILLIEPHIYLPHKRRQLVLGDQLGEHVVVSA